MVSLGCDVGLPASGGRVAVRVDGTEVTTAPAGEPAANLPVAVAGTRLRTLTGAQ